MVRGLTISFQEIGGGVPENDLEGQKSNSLQLSRQQVPGTAQKVGQRKPQIVPGEECD